MKKLMMFAAAMTIVGGAHAQCNDSLDCAQVWDVKMSLKTTQAATLKAKNVCADNACYRKPGKKSLNGFLFVGGGCGECTCASINDAVFYLWDKKAKEMVVDGGEISWSFLHIIGKKDTEAEGLFGITSDEGIELTGAGFGKWDLKNKILKSLSGEIVGAGAPPACSIDCTDEIPAVAFICTADGIEEVEDAPTAYSGKFSIKYSKGSSKKAANYGDADILLPKWVW